MPPEGISCPNNEVLILQKAIYGLKQASRCWQDKLNNILSKFGLGPTNSDPCLYHGIYKDNHIIMAVYVDKGIAASNNDDTLIELIDHLNTQIKIKIVETNYFVGFEIRQIDKFKIILHQQDYIIRMLSKFNMKDCK